MSNEILAQPVASPGSSGLSCRLDFPNDHGLHRSSEIEWWYVFGFLGARWTIMACVWRYQALGLPEGLMACYALTEIAGTRRSRGTWIDRPMLALSREILGAGVQNDPFTEGVLELTRNGESFAPYGLADRSGLSSNGPGEVTATVGPVEIRRDPTERVLRLRVAHGGVEAEVGMDLDSVSFPMNATGRFEIAGKRMSGYTHPQAAASASIVVDGERQALTGRAWLDHQWGDWAFDRPNAALSHPEWHYFAVPFDDGKSLVLSFEKQASEPRLVYGCWCGADGVVTSLTRAGFRSSDRVQSLRTRNVYDYGWGIEIPELDAVLALEPFHADHEVLTFTRERGFLELGVRVSGTIFGRACESLGFVETFGESIDLHRVFWESRSPATTRQIEKFLPRRSTPEWLRRLTGSARPLAVDPEVIDRVLVDPIWSMVDRGGKAWRSAWFVLCCHALGFEESDERLRELMPVIELIHTGSLIIDDVQDESPMRRGAPALHEQIGQDLAINVGSFLYFLPMMIIQDVAWLTDEQRLEAYHRIAIAQRQGHVGQGLDLAWSKGRYDVRDKVARFERARDELLEQYRLKCGCQLEAAARIAGSLARAPENQVEALADYSRVFGIVYQIVDDLKDAAVTSNDLGKPSGEDLRNGRLNLVLLHALAAAPARQGAAVADALTARRSDRTELARELIVATRAVESCLDLAERLMHEAESSWNVLPPTDAKIALRSIPRCLIEERRQRARIDAG